MRTRTLGDYYVRRKASDRLSRDVHYISGLMKHHVPFIVTAVVTHSLAAW